MQLLLKTAISPSVALCVEIGFCQIQSHIGTECPLEYLQVLVTTLFPYFLHPN